MTVFGRVNRAVKQVAGLSPVVVAGVLATYDPQLIAGVAAVGLGMAGGLGGGGSATGRAVDAVSGWGVRERRRFLPLPRRVLVVVTNDDVRLYEWSMAGVGKQRLLLPAGTFRAERTHSFGEVGVSLAPANAKLAMLSSKGGPLHRRNRRLVKAILAKATRQLPTT